MTKKRKRRSFLSKKIMVSLTEEMYEHVKKMGRFFGSMSGYIRYLIMSDMQPARTVPSVRRIVLREKEIEMRIETQKQPRMLGYGALHAELMREMKEKLKERYVE